MSEDINKFTAEVEALRKAHEEGNKTTVDALNLKLDEQEKKSQELFLSKSQAEKEAKELTDRINALEADLKRSPNASSEEVESKKIELKAYENYLCKSTRDFLDSADKKYLRTDNNEQGGYLVPIAQEFDIIKKITEISPIRSLAKVRTMSSKINRMPTRRTLVSGGWVGEGDQNNLSNSTYGREELVAKKLSVTVETTSEELQDASPNLVSEINSDVAEAFAQLQGAAFVNGSGANTPEGFMTNADIPEINSTDAATLIFDNFASMEGELKTGYNAMFGFNRRTLAIIRNLKDGAGAYIWRAGNLGAGIPNTINGVPYVEIPDMPDIGAGTYPVILGDFSKGYMIGDRLGFTTVRDDLTQARNDKVLFTFKTRLDAAVILPEAFVKLKISV